jgi:hypothetical protein
MSGMSKVKAAHAFFSEKARDGSTFTIREVCEATGWKERTVCTYIAKHWEHLISKESSTEYRCSEEFLSYPLDVFERMSSQKYLINKDPFRPILLKRTEELVMKSRESALLAIQVYNNPMLSFRTPSFIVHMIIAFTSLFHAIFEESKIDYCYRNADGTTMMINGEPKLWDISECVRAYFNDEKGAARKNLEMFIDLRNVIEHRYAPALDMRISGECQALLFNYEKILVEEFGPYYSLATQVAIPMQLSKISSQAKINAQRELQKADFKFLSEHIRIYQDALDDEIVRSQDFCFRVLLIPKLVNRASASDISIEFIKLDEHSRTFVEGVQHQYAAFIKTKTVPVANQGLLRASDVVSIIQETTEPRFIMHHHVLAWKYFNVRPKEKMPEGCDPRYCQYDEPHRDFVYTSEWVELLARSIKDEETYRKIREYKE